MSKLSASIFTVLAVGAVGYAVLQQRAVEQLRSENRTLREQMEAGGTPGPGNVPAKGAASAPDSRESAATSTSIAAAGGAPTGAAPAGNGLATPATDPMRELLRLRSEVGQLRRSVQESAAAATAARRAGANATAGAGTGGPGSGPPPPNPGEDNQPYTAHLSANVVKGNTLVAGGWSTEPGKRTLLLLTPDFGTANLTTGQVSLRSVFVKAPEEVLTRLGLGGFQTEGRGSTYTSSLGSAELAALMSSFAATDGVDILTAPQITTAEGRAAEVTIGPTGQGPSVTYVPRLSADQQGVDIAIKAQLPGRPPGTNAPAN